MALVPSQCIHLQLYKVNLEEKGEATTNKNQERERERESCYNKASQVKTFGKLPVDMAVIRHSSLLKLMTSYKLELREFPLLSNVMIIHNVGLCIS